MKREYMKPTMRVVKLRQQHSLLVTSGETLETYSGDNQVTSEEDVW